MRAASIATVVALTAAWPTAQEIPTGAIVDGVACLDDPSQTYALYLPSTYSPDRPSAALMGFHPAGRGRAIVETYQAAAEQYGYIVAASNNSRNGPWAASAAAVKAMTGDLAGRFAIDAGRVYVTGHSGGARLALQVALNSDRIAGVIASSAGFPDSLPRQSVSFPLFATAGTEDFNYIELGELDRTLTSPHRLAVFQGGHTLPPPAVALDGIEWLELQAMRTGRRPRDQALIDRLFEKRQRAVAAAAAPIDTLRLLEALVEDFEGLRDVSADAARRLSLAGQPEVQKAVARERSGATAEARQLTEIFELEGGLREPEYRFEALSRLRERIARVARAASAREDSPERARARRVLQAVIAGAGDRVQDTQYRQLLEGYGLRKR